MWHGWLILRNSMLEVRREVELKLNVRHSIRVATEERLNVTALLFTNFVTIHKLLNVLRYCI